MNPTTPSILSGSRRRHLVELCVGYALILIVIWTPRHWQRPIYLVTAAFISIVLWKSAPGTEAMGLRTANLARSIWLLGAALIASALAVTIARRMHTLHSPGGPLQILGRYAGYVVFAFVQQFLLQNFILARLEALMRRPMLAAVVAAALFSAVHLPNPILTVATFFWGLAACLFFLRNHNLYALAVAHAILGVTLAVCVPGPVVRNMRVGLGYLTYPTHHAGYRNH